MGEREMTLGEEIIELATKGVDTSIIERMYRKYIKIEADKDAKESMEKYWINDELAIEEFINTSFGVPSKSNFKDAKVGDKTTIKLCGLGEFLATVHKVTDNKVMLIFDDYVAKRPMNESDTNNGGFEASYLNKWLHTEFIKALPYSIRGRLTDVTIPTLGEIFDLDGKFDIFEADNDRQLPLMKQRRNRVAYHDNEYTFGWLRNATKKEVSAAYFALAYYDGIVYSGNASNSYGVRPEIWLFK